MKLYLVLNKCGEGAAFDKRSDAESAISGKFYGFYSSLAESFNEIYPDDNRLVEIDVPAQSP